MDKTKMNPAPCRILEIDGNALDLDRIVAVSPIDTYTTKYDKKHYFDITMSSGPDFRIMWRNKSQVVELRDRLVNVWKAYHNYFDGIKHEKTS